MFLALQIFESLCSTVNRGGLGLTGLIEPGETYCFCVSPVSQFTLSVQIYISCMTLSPAFLDETSKNHVNLTTIGLLHESFHRLEDGDSSGAAWLQAIGGSTPLSALLSAVQHAIVKKPNGGLNDSSTLVFYVENYKIRSIVVDIILGSKLE